MKLLVKKMGINGEGIAYYKRKPVFVDGAFPNEIIECDLKSQGTYYLGALKKIYQRSKERINSPCLYQNSCNACELMQLKYSKQLVYKKELLKEALKKYANYDGEISDMVKSNDIYHYRNKCNMPFVYNDDLKNALYYKNSNKPIIIDNCLIHDNELEICRNKILDVLNKYECLSYDRKTKKGYRQLVLRNLNNNCQLVLVTGDDLIDNNLVDDLSKIKNIKSIYQVINTKKDTINLLDGRRKLLYGSAKIDFNLEKYQFKIDPASFFQLNYKQAINIYNEVNNLIANKVDLIVEAYCGIGAMSIFVSDKAENVIGIEIVKEAIIDARENSKLNNIDNIEFVVGDAGRKIEEIGRHKNIDVLIVDPPRTGLDQRLIKCLLENKVKQIIYVSCNPATLAKDLSYLQKHYRIDSIKAFDMFPNTPLVETIANLYHI